MSWKKLIKRLVGQEKISSKNDKEELHKPTSKKKKIKTDPASKEKKFSSRKGKYNSTITQYAGSHQDQPWLQIIIGLDFGTAFTKVVISESRARYIVPLGEISGYKDFCLPCALFIGPENQVSLKNNKTCSQKIQNLKMPLIEENYRHDDLALIVAYLAMVLHSARSWFLSEHKAIYQGKYFDWNINIGLPTENFQDDSLVNLYQNLTGAAWHLSTSEKEFTLNDAKDSLNLISKSVQKETQNKLLLEKILHSEKINCFPEFVALVSGYVRSPRRKEDLHLLVDVGAGTVDVTVFNIHKDEFSEDVFPIFAKGVKSLGTSYLLKSRFEKMGRSENVDPTLQVPNNYQFSINEKISLDDLKEIDSEFCRDFRVLVVGELKRVKHKRYRKSPRWESGVPCFLSGGGRSLETYLDELKKMVSPNFPFRISLEELPFPNDLRGLEGCDDGFHRLLVAYGLSVDPFDIGKIVKSQDVPDDSEPDLGLPSYEENYICKEMT